MSPRLTAINRAYRGKLEHSFLEKCTRRRHGAPFNDWRKPTTMIKSSPLIFLQVIPTPAAAGPDPTVRRHVRKLAKAPASKMDEAYEMASAHFLALVLHARTMFGTHSFTENVQSWLNEIEGCVDEIHMEYERGELALGTLSRGDQLLDNLTSVLNDSTWELRFPDGVDDAEDEILEFIFGTLEYWARQVREHGFAYASFLSGTTTGYSVHSSLTHANGISYPYCGA
jgi:hypothetical protein